MPSCIYAQSFGLQPDGCRVFSNCVVLPDGEVRSHNQAGYFYDPTAFMNDPLAPLTEQQMPSLYRGYETDVGRRYDTLLKAADVCKRMQRKNFHLCMLLLGIKIAAIHLLKVKRWLKGFPITLVIASEGGIGKTEAMMFASCFMGFGLDAMFVKTSEPMLYEMLSLFSSCSLDYDDFVNKMGALSNDIKPLYGLGFRNVCGKTRQPKSAITGSCNQGCNGADGDQPVWRRVIQLMMEKNENMISNAKNFRDWNNLMRTGQLSCLYPDFMRLMVDQDGDLDEESLDELAAWLMALFDVAGIPETPSMAKNWAIITYPTLLTYHLRNAEEMEIDGLLQLVCEKAIQRVWEVAKGSELLSRFADGLRCLKQSGNHMNSDKCAGFHLYREVGTEAYLMLHPLVRNIRSFPEFREIDVDLLTRHFNLQYKKEEKSFYNASCRGWPPKDEENRVIFDWDSLDASMVVQHVCFVVPLAHLKGRYDYRFMLSLSMLDNSETGRVPLQAAGLQGYAYMSLQSTARSHLMIMPLLSRTFISMYLKSFILLLFIVRAKIELTKPVTLVSISWIARLISLTISAGRSDRSYCSRAGELGRFIC